MADTIHEFVEKIRTEGVQAGQKQAEEVLAEARGQAEEVLAQAGREKEKILADAKTEAEGILARSRSELELAARDAVFRLRDALARALGALLAHAAGGKLADAEFVGTALHEIIIQYGKTEVEGARTFRINVPDEMRQKLIDWALQELGQEAIDGSHVGIDLKGQLAQAGFEYSVSGATVEVTLDSVVELMSELVGPGLRDVLEKATAEDTK